MYTNSEILQYESVSLLCSCVFVWRLPKEMTSQMQSRMREIGKLPLPTTLTNGGFK